MRAGEALLLPDSVRGACQEAAAWAASHGGSLSEDDKLALYGLYKQATHGPCGAPAPSLLEFTARAKWCAAALCTWERRVEPSSAFCRHSWRALRDMSTAEAMVGYVRLSAMLAQQAR